MSRYEDAFNRFIDEINSIAAYDWWEGSVHSILLVLAYPCAWSWKQWRRRIKIQRLQEYVKSEYDHSCLRSCRARALYKGMKVFIFVNFGINMLFCSNNLPMPKFSVHHEVSIFHDFHKMCMRR